jgi:hypothetical protein
LKGRTFQEKSTWGKVKNISNTIFARKDFRTRLTRRLRTAEGASNDLYLCTFFLVYWIQILHYSRYSFVNKPIIYNNVILLSMKNITSSYTHIYTQGGNHMEYLKHSVTVSISEEWVNERMEWRGNIHDILNPLKSTL